MNRFIATSLGLVAATSAFAADETITLTIDNHVFYQKEIKVPAGKKFDLKVVNNDGTPAEFESKPLSREKVIPAKSSAVIHLGPLKPGRYAFVEEFHEKQAGAQGTIVAE